MRTLLLKSSNKTRVEEGTFFMEEIQLTNANKMLIGWWRAWVDTIRMNALNNLSLSTSEKIGNYVPCDVKVVCSIIYKEYSS